MNITRNARKSGLEPAVKVPYELNEEILTIAAAWPDRFRSKVRISNGCWEWQASKPKAYGRYYMGKRPVTGKRYNLNAHRAGLILAGFDVPDEHVTDHLCRNTGCVRPDHLETITQAVNTARGRAANVAGACRAGAHPWVAENIIIESEGTRRCRPCRDERELAYRPPSGNAPGDRTHCPQGHAYNKENTRVKANGDRDCRACHRVAERIRYRKRNGLEIMEEHYAA